MERSERTNDKKERTDWVTLCHSKCDRAQKNVERGHSCFLPSTQISIPDNRVRNGYSTLQNVIGALRGVMGDLSLYALVQKRKYCTRNVGFDKPSKPHQGLLLSSQSAKDQAKKPTKGSWAL